jgi:DNA-binding LytR/AlgR family response regulator
VYYNFEKAKTGIQQSDFDLAISDIDLGHGTEEKSGLLLMEYLKTMRDCPIIFLTAFGDRNTIAKAARLMPSAYLIKPVNTTSLYAAVQIAIENFNSKKAAVFTETIQPLPGYFFARIGKKMIRVNWEDVYYLEAVKNYVNIKTSQYASSVPVRSSLQNVIATMIPDNFKNKFVKINRAELIAKSAIRAIDGNKVITDFGLFALTTEVKMNDL